MRTPGVPTPANPIFSKEPPVVDISQILVDDLHELMVDLGHSGSDLVPIGSALRRDARLAIRSYLGCVLVLPSDLGLSLQLVMADGPLDLAETGTSLRVIWPQPSTAAESGHVTFYAARPGDLVDFAAQLLAVADLGPESLQLDLPQPEVVLQPGLVGLDLFRAAQQAIGILVAQGFSDTAARARIRTAPDPAVAIHAIVQSVTAES